MDNSALPRQPRVSLPPFEKLRVFLEMIKVSHTLFALPFAIGSAFLAAEGAPTAMVLGKIVLAVLLARTAAMAFNRVADRKIDSANPRTADRALASGELSVAFAVGSIVVSLVGFVAVAATLNTLALALSPVAIAVILGYSLTKRFTRWCHWVLGVALAIAPMGAWVAVRGTLEWVPVLLGVAVLLWTSGFDIIYSCLDAHFDREAGLRSIPATVGIDRALGIAAMLHLSMWIALVALGFLSPALTPLYDAVLVGIALLLFYQHRIVSAADLSRVNRSFFTTNAIISFTIMMTLIAETLRS